MKYGFAMVVGLVLWSSLPSSACMPIADGPLPVVVAGEEAVIAYDSRTGTERFIRKATFDTRNRDFGFLVPTPTVPQLSESSELLFDRVHTLIRTPVVKTVTRYIWGRREAMATSASISSTDPFATQVQVQQTQRVGDFDTTVLKATDTSALMRWLRKHGYVSSPELWEWVEPYVRQGYAITAFRIAADVRGKKQPPSAGTSVALSPVCLTFQTPAPFYPYRESKSAVPRDGRILRVYYFGDKRVTGRLGDSSANASEEWAASTIQSRSLSRDDKENVAALETGLRPEQIGDRLTVFQDNASLRARKDLFFPVAMNQATLVPTRTEYDDIDVSSAVLTVVGSIFAGTTLAWWIRRRKR